jgi:hypothetical protein
MPSIMPYDGSGITRYVVYLLWTCLSLTESKWRNPVFTMVLATQVLLQQFVSDSLLEFAPNLSDVVQRTTPPLLSDFKSLPTHVCKCWAVYLHVLEKRRCRFRIYIGVGTQASHGVLHRLQNYDSQTSLPRHVQEAFDDGYTITHTGLLCWAAIPPVLLRFPVRVVFVLLEATVAIVFWAMISREKDYGMPRLSPWDAKDIAWDGCCSHSSLLEGVHGEEEGLTPEQIAAKLLEQDRIRKEKMVVRSIATQPTLRANNKATQRYHCNTCNKSYMSNHALELHKTSPMHKNNVMGIKKVLSRPRGKRLDDENRKQKRFFCDTCKLPCASNSKLQRHKETPRHIEKAAKAAASMT